MLIHVVYLDTESKKSAERCQDYGPEADLVVGAFWDLFVLDGLGQVKRLIPNMINPIP